MGFVMFLAQRLDFARRPTSGMNWSRQGLQLQKQANDKLQVNAKTPCKTSRLNILAHRLVDVSTSFAQCPEHKALHVANVVGSEAFLTTQHFSILVVHRVFFWGGVGEQFDCHHLGGFRSMAISVVMGSQFLVGLPWVGLGSDHLTTLCGSFRGSLSLQCG
eukprot:718778-Amphidinium_carterae.1